LKNLHSQFRGRVALRKNRARMGAAPLSAGGATANGAAVAQALDSTDGDMDQPTNGQEAEAQVHPSDTPNDGGGADNAEDDEIDFTDDNTKSREAAPALVPYDPRPAEDGARRAIAFMLIGILFVIIGAVLIMVAWGSIHVSDLKEFAVILGPVITLVSAATGFYYGTKSQ